MSEAPTARRPRGRPVTNPYPPRIDASPEEIASVMLAPPPERVVKSYRCGRCEGLVSYPETLHDDGLCGTCHGG